MQSMDQIQFGEILNSNPFALGVPYKALRPYLQSLGRKSYLQKIKDIRKGIHFLWKGKDSLRILQNQFVIIIFTYFQ
jgi:hypothetical protein